MHIAKTVLAVADRTNPLVSQIMDRGTPLTRALAAQVMSQTQLSYHGRRPRSAVTSEGMVRKTNLDLLSLLADLNRRSARVTIMSYCNRLPWEAYAGEQHVGGTKRFGHITGLISHREQLSFSVQIKDESVVQCIDGGVVQGAYRTYMLADYTGAWHQGWAGFTWDMNPEERAYLERRNLFVNGSVDCEDYVHRNRRQSVMGAPYLLLKLLWQRIENEISFFEREIKRLERFGIEYPADLEPQSRFKLAVGASRSIEVPVFTMRLDGIDYTGAYTPVSTDTLGYRLAHRSISFLARKLRPAVQFMMRADEVAFYRFGLEQGFVSNWVKGSAWSHRSPWAGHIALGDTLTLSYQKGVVEKKIAA